MGFAGVTGRFWSVYGEQRREGGDWIEDTSSTRTPSSLLGDGRIGHPNQHQDDSGLGLYEDRSWNYVDQSGGPEVETTGLVFEGEPGRGTISFW